MAGKRRKAKKIVDSYDILVLGCGGTGTYFLKEFNHFLARNKQACERIKSLTIADGDSVEEKNLDRQCFELEDIGRNKASVFAEILNDTFGCLKSGYSRLSWRAVPSYITSVKDVKKALRDAYSGYYGTSDYGNTLSVRIPLIISCVDNDAARLMCEEFFKEEEYCFLYDSGNEFSTGEVNFAHRFKGKTLSYEKSLSFPQIFNGDLRHVNEMSCAELNESAPQHFLTNMTAAQHLLRGCVRLFTDMKEKSVFERIDPQLGFVFFDAFSGVSEFTERSFRTVEVAKEEEKPAKAS